VTPRGIHHINFIVRDLDEAMPRFEEMLGLQSFVVVDHAARGARVARSKVGDTWFVLVAPYDPESVPGKYLAEHGEGFFLVSLSADEIVNPRDGILDWKVEDLGEIHGACFQLTEDSSR